MACIRSQEGENMSVVGKVLTIKKAAAVLDLSVSHICRLCRANSIGEKVGRDRMLSHSDVEAIAKLKSTKPVGRPRKKR